MNEIDMTDDDLAPSNRLNCDKSLAARTEIDLERLRSLYEDQRLTITACAEQLDTYPDKIRKIIRETGIYQRREAHDLERLRHLYVDRGLTMTECAKEFDTVTSAISLRLKKAGIPSNRPPKQTDEEVRLARNRVVLRRVRRWRTERGLPVHDILTPFDKTPEGRHLRKIKSQKRYRDKNSEALNAYARASAKKNKDRNWQRTKKRLETDTAFYLRCLNRKRINMALKSYAKDPLQKPGRSIALLGCSAEFYEEYIVSLFTEGMTVEALRSGLIHIDHIVPLCRFNMLCPYERAVGFNYRNTQPLWAEDNWRKNKSFSPDSLDWSGCFTSLRDPTISPEDDVEWGPLIEIEHVEDEKV